MSQYTHLLGERPGMSNEDYHGAAGWSSSHIKAFAKSPQDFYDEHIDPPPPLSPDTDPPTLAEQWAEDTKRGLILGSAIHLAVLQPDLVDSQVIKMPSLNLKTNAGRAERDALLEDNTGRLVLKADDYEMMLRCRDAVRAHPVARKLLSAGRAEVPTFAIDPETGELVKCMPDWENDVIGALVDLKSTDAAGQSEFERQQVNLGYEFQPPWYIDVLAAHRGANFAPKFWAWIVVEKRLRPRVEVYYQPPEEVEADRITVRHHFRRLLEMRNMHPWPLSETQDMARPLGKPAWYRRPAP